MADKKSELIELIVRQAEKIKAEQAERSPIDWEKRKKWWVGQVDSLYTLLRSTLKPAEEAGALEVVRRPIQLREEALGEYSVDQMLLNFGGAKVVLRPVATVIVGAVGRVDVNGPAGSARLILATPDDEEPAEYMTNAKWHVTSPQRKLPLAELDVITLLELFAQLMGSREV